MIRLALESVLPTVLCFMINAGGDDNWYENDLPDWCPTALQPIIECAVNYDMFRKNAIVPARQQRLPDYMQHDSRTSDFAKFLGEETGMSPTKIDHFLYGYTGKLGQEGLRVAESLAPWVDREYNFKGISDTPLIGGFFRVSYRNPRIMTEFYETLDEQTKLHNEFNLTKKRPEGYNHSLYTKLHKVQKEMQKLTKMERKVLDDPKLEAGERDDRQLAIQKKRVALAERVLR